MYFTAFYTFCLIIVCLKLPHNEACHILPGPDLSHLLTRIAKLGASRLFSQSLSSDDMLFESVRRLAKWSMSGKRSAQLALACDCASYLHGRQSIFAHFSAAEGPLTSACCAKGDIPTGRCQAAVTNVFLESILELRQHFVRSAQENWLFP